MKILKPVAYRISKKHNDYRKFIQVRYSFLPFYINIDKWVSTNFFDQLCDGNPSSNGHIDDISDAILEAEAKAWFNRGNAGYKTESKKF